MRTFSAGVCTFAPSNCLTNQNSFLNMKKALLGLFTMATLGLASCGEKLLTEAEVTAEITKGIDAGKAAVIDEESKVCDAGFDARVEEGVQAKVAEAAAVKAAEAPAPMPAKKK
jgi:hypothetical protein